MPNAGGVETSNVSTNQQGVVVRYFAGIMRFAVTWLGPAYNQKTKPVQSAGGGKAASAAAGASHNYYADCAGLLSVGLVDQCVAIYMNNTQVWPSVTGAPINRLPGQDSIEITIPKYGTCTLYWGTETQPVDPILAPFNHPAYRGQCYGVFNQLLFGQDTTTAPNIEFVLLRSPQNTGLATEPDWDSDTNIAHAIVELLTDQRFGLGWDPALTIVLSTFDAAAAQMRTEQLGFSPLLDDSKDARSAINDACSYFDGYLWADPANGGRLALGLTRPFGGDPTTLPLWGEYELLDVPDPTSQSWWETFNEISVNFTDRDNFYQSNSTIFVDPGNRRIVGEPLTTSLDRPWITREYQATKAAVYAARLQSVPWTEAKDIHIRKDAAVGINPGDFVRLTYAEYADTLVMRVISRKVDSDRSQQVAFDLRAEGYYSEVELYTADHPPVPANPDIEPEPLLYQNVLEVPYGLVPAGRSTLEPQLTVLAARASALDVRYIVYSSEDDTTYDRVGHSRRFAIYGTLAANVALMNTLDDGASGLLIECPGVEAAIDVATTTDAGRLRQRLLVFLENEIIAYRDAAVISATQVQLTGLRRGCYDTIIAAHAAGAPLAIVARADLLVWTDAVYEQGAEVFIKAASATGLSELDLSDAGEVDLTLVNRTGKPLAPVNLQINDVGLAPTFDPSADVSIAWDITNWERNGFWESWDDSYDDDLLKHVVRILSADGSAVIRHIKVAAVVDTYTYANGDLLSDFGGSAPSSFQVMVFSVRRGLHSAASLVQVVTSSPTSAALGQPRSNWMSPSAMSQVLGTVDPAPLVDRNLAMIAAHWGLSLPPTIGLDQTTAPAALQANFATIATARSLTLYPVQSRDPEACAQANFEIINAAW